jgi:DNA-directed RNA polymerase specialized sigma subunit
MYITEEDKIKKCEIASDERRSWLIGTTLTPEELVGAPIKDPPKSSASDDNPLPVDPYSKGANPSVIEQNLEDILRTFSKLERCVFWYRIKEEYPLSEVAKKCWDKPVTIQNVSRVLTKITKKIRNYFFKDPEP